MFNEGGTILQFLLSLFIALSVILLLRHFAKCKSHNREATTTLSRYQLSLQKLCSRLDKQLYKLGLQRTPNMTLLAFAEHTAQNNLPVDLTDSLKSWYTQYNRLRFGQYIERSEFEQLQNCASQLLRKIKRVPNHSK